MRIIKSIFLTLVTLVLLAAAAVFCIWGKEIRTITSVHMVGENAYLYEMDYYASYDLDDIIASDIDENSKLLSYVIGKVAKGLPFSPSLSAGPASMEGEHCTSFQAAKAGSSGYLFGRNYDYFKNPIMVTRSNPKNGYKSMAVSDMSHFGYSLDKVPSSLKEKVLCIASVYAPVDGINEKGLCTSIMALPNQASRQSTGKHAVGTTIIMRLFLDRCATVEEAIELLSTVDVRHDEKAGSGYHYMIADAKGDCAVIEFDKDDGWKTMITRKGSKPFMHVTNHLLDPKYYTTEPDPSVGNPNSHSWWRYEVVQNFLSSYDGKITVEQAQKCLSKVHWVDLVWDNGTVEDTQYSNVYDQDELILRMRPWNDYDTTYEFSFED